MSLKSFGNKRDEVEQEVVRTLKQMGALVYKLTAPADLLIDWRGKWMLVECKSSQNSQFTAVQEDLVDKANAPVIIAYGAKDVIDKITRKEGE